MSDGVDMVGNVGGVIWLDRYGEIRHPFRTTVTLSAVGILWCGVDGGVTDSSPQVSSRHQYGNRLGIATSQ